MLRYSEVQVQVFCWLIKPTYIYVPEQSKHYYKFCLSVFPNWYAVPAVPPDMIQIYIPIVCTRIQSLSSATPLRWCNTTLFRLHLIHLCCTACAGLLVPVSQQWQQDWGHLSSFCSATLNFLEKVLTGARIISISTLTSKKKEKQNKRNKLWNEEVEF